MMLEGIMLFLKLQLGVSTVFGFYLQDSLLKSLNPDRWRGSKALHPHDMARVT
ncbi:hypothetical protein M6B38_267120 [Iris pallida]|uniref:Uncharacterized protein n=1 Tax=Iris pallida TaxID=29817 RepID=A0AAX6I9B4_IRIPA|nr:hypothetical protein M6B38_267120 [Iris pallida]